MQDEYDFNGAMKKDLKKKGSHNKMSKNNQQEK